VTRAADALAAFLFPQGCHVCGRPVLRRADGVACGACWSDPRVTPLFGDRAVCGRCGLPGTGACLSCAPPGIAAHRSAGLYAGALRAALLDLKRRPRPCRRLAALLVGVVRSERALAAPDLVVPVPLHPERLADRGHNQALSLAEALVRAERLTLETHALARVRGASRRRAGLGREDRAESVRGAFRASGRLVAGRSVLLVDDVFTTGATLGACAAALLAAGAREVRAVTAARVGYGAAGLGPKTPAS
jgi:ComF family protein